MKAFWVRPPEIETHEPEGHDCNHEIMSFLKGRSILCDPKAFSFVNVKRGHLHLPVYVNVDAMHMWK